ncbi:TetR family transcriptional regulator [Streptomyces mirabilis]|uniref:TetR family transcriptional regulator n=1 Tax=Streptomyces mirabilis TaxID=68239 RepID=UPI00368D5771
MGRQRDATAPSPRRDREFALKGCYDTSAEAIAKCAGVTQPYLFRLFPGEKAIAAALTRSTEERPPGVRERGQG